MRSSALAQCLLTTALFAAGVNAHFQLQFPAPRGVFAEDPETGLCDGYLTAAPNRTEFPLSGGFFSLNSEHPSWTAGVTISTKANPTSFDDFQLVNTFFEAKGEGLFCFPLDFSKSNASSLLTSGQNVTIEVVFSGGDGQLYQCADLTLSDNFTISSSVACTNGTGSTSTSGTGTPAPTSTSPGGAQTTNKSSALSGYASAHSVTAIVFAAFGLALA